MEREEGYDRIELVANTFGKVPCTQECPEDCSEYGAPWCRMTRDAKNLFPCGNLYPCYARCEHPDTCSYCEKNPRCEGADEYRAMVAEAELWRALDPVATRPEPEDDGIPF